MLVAGFVVLFIGGGARFAVGLTLKSVVEEFDWGRSELGFAVALFQIVSAVTMYIAGRLSDRMNPRVVLCGGLAVAGVGIGLMSLMTAPWHAFVLFGIVFAVGNGAASIVPVAVLVARGFPQRAGLANAVVTAGMSVGQLVVISGLAAILVAIGWQPVYLCLGIAHLVLVLPLLAALPRGTQSATHALLLRIPGMTVTQSARTQRFWLLLGVYAICGFDDFFVTTHVVAFAQDKGVDAFIAGNLLALMGLTGLVGVLAAGAWSDRSGPVAATAASFAARIAAFALIMVDQSPVAVAIFALVFGVTFLVTAPLTVVFVSESFGTRHLGALTGLITMVHHVCGGIGAYLGAAVFDASGRYDTAFVIMLASAVIALMLTLALRRTAIVPHANR